MSQQLNSGEPETPLWIPYMEFSAKEECMTFARNNQLRIFSKAAESYNHRILPTMLNCVNQEMMKSLSDTIGEKKDEKDV